MTSAQIGFAGKNGSRARDSAWDSGYRMLIGYGVMPAYLQLAGANRAPWKLFVFLPRRAGGAANRARVLRRVLPFSREVKTVWAERRALARRYDSYQWRKLFAWDWGDPISAGCGQGAGCSAVSWRRMHRLGRARPVVLVQAQQNPHGSRQPRCTCSVASV